MQPDQVIEQFELLRRLGWVRPLEARFVAFLADLDPPGDGLVLLAAGLVSHALALGHVSLEIAALVDDPPRWLALPPEATHWRLADRVDAHDLDRARRLLDQDLRALDPESWLNALQQSPLVSAGTGTTPLVLADGRLYLRRNWAAGREVLEDLRARGEPRDLSIDSAALQALIEPLFPADDPASGPNWQKIACAVALRHGFSIITGGPGTGKTWTMVKLLGLLQAVNQAAGATRPLRALLAAPTGKAAARMSEAVRNNWHGLPAAFQRDDWRPEEARTLHRLLGSQAHSRHFRHQRHHPVPADLVIVDEASMIDLQLMQALVRGLDPQTRLVLLGDKDQLAAVEPGAVFGDLCRDAERVAFDAALIDWLAAVSGERLANAGTGVGAGVGQALTNQTVVLRQARRFNQDIAALATAVNAGAAERALELLDQRAPVLARLQPPGPDAAAVRRLLIDQGHAGYLQTVQQPPWLHTDDPTAIAQAAAQPDALEAWARAALADLARFQVLTCTRAGAWGVEETNRRIRRWLTEDGLIEGAGRWFHGRPVMIHRNDYRSGLMNGDVGLCLRWPQADGHSQLRVMFQKADGRLQHYATTRIDDCETAWAMTVHKSQGSEFMHTVLVLPDRHHRVLGRELIYTGLTRARARFTLIAPDPSVLARAIRERAERSPTLAVGAGSAG